MKARRFLVCFCMLSISFGINALEATVVKKGKTPTYHEVNGVMTHDLSGAASDGEFIVTVDDGGKGFVYQYLHSMKTDHSSRTSFKLTERHKDFEGATYQNGYFVVTTSLSDRSPENKAQRLTTRFKWDGKTVSDEQSVDLRGAIEEAMKQSFPEPWWKQVFASKAKKGGINIEGITVSGKNSDDLVLGLRSPLGGDVSVNKSFTMHTGPAVLATVKNAFSDNPTFSFMSIDLKGHGVRAIEYIPSLAGYVIVGGPTFKARDYSLWYLPVRSSVPEPIKLDGFDNLCRPESVIPGESNHFTVFSEEAGDSCKDVDFTYIQAHME